MLRFIGDKGYVLLKIDGKLVREHRREWEKVHGPIPEGFQVHHRNGIRHDNRLENLECLNTVEHKRAHCGHVWKDGRWYKRCTDCGIELPEDQYPTKRYVRGVRMTWGIATPVTESGCSGYEKASGRGGDG